MRKKQRKQLRALKYTLFTLSIPIVPFLITPAFNRIAKYHLNDLVGIYSGFTKYVISLTRYLFSYSSIIFTIAVFVSAIILLNIRMIVKSESKKNRALKQFLKLGFFIIAYSTTVAVSVIASYFIIKEQSHSDLKKIVEEVQNRDATEIVSTNEDELNNYITSADQPQFKFNDKDLERKITNDEIEKHKTYSAFYKSILKETNKIYEFPLEKIRETDAFLYNNTLYINDFTPEHTHLYQKLGKHFVKDYLREKNTEYPNIFIVTRDEYIEKREGEIDELIQEYDEYIATLKESIKEVERWIEEDKEYAQKYGGVWWDWLEQDREWLEYYEESLAEWEEWRDRIAERKIDALTELGRFSPPKDIDIVLAEYEYYPADQYLGTLVHEYFHYISDEENAFLHDFWEESITEYYTQKVTTEKLGYNNHYSYSNIVPMMEEIIDDIGEEKILEIYFSKNQEEANRILNETYGEDFWQNYENKLYHATYMYDEESEKIVEEVMGIIK